MAKVWVYAELNGGKLQTTALELMAKARGLGDVEAIALGTGAKAAAAVLGKHGAKVVHVNEDKAFDDFIAEPRYASLKGIMAARSKEIKQVGLGELGVERGEPGETIEGLADAEARKAGAIVQDDGTAVDRFLQVLAEAKVV